MTGLLNDFHSWEFIFLIRMALSILLIFTLEKWSQIIIEFFFGNNELTEKKAMNKLALNKLSTTVFSKYVDTQLLEMEMGNEISTSYQNKKNRSTLIGNSE